MRLAAAAVLLMALSGCTQAVPTATDDGPLGIPVADVEDVPLATLEGECIGWSLSAPVPTEWVDAELPSPFYSAGLGAAGAEFSGPNLLAFACRASIDGHQPVAFRYAQTGVYLTGSSFYRWESFVDEDAPHLLPLLQSLGWDARAATIDLRDGIHVHAPDIAYDVDTVLQGRRPPTEPALLEARVMHAVRGETHLYSTEWLWTAAGAEDSDAGELEAEGGVLQRIGARGPGTLHGTLSQVATPWTVTFYAEPMDAMNDPWWAGYPPAP